MHLEQLSLPLYLFLIDLKLVYWKKFFGCGDFFRQTEFFYFGVINIFLWRLEAFGVSGISSASLKITKAFLLFVRNSSDLPSFSC